MATSYLDASHATEELTRRQLARALFAASIGSTIEWYDFTIYGLAGALYIGKLYFPKSDPLAATLLAFATFSIGFVFRPIGAAVFGHFGDRIGRKATLITTLLLMGLSTFLIGLVPTYAEIGIAGAVILVLLRICQGLAVGGEWGGSVLLTVEWGNRGRRGLLGAVPQAGAPAGLALAYLVFQASTVMLGPNSYWGWRAPFLISLALVAVGLYIRLGILETPIFAKILEERRVERLPVVQVLRKNWGEVLLTCFMRASQQNAAFIFNTFVATYTVTVLHFKQADVYNWLIIAAIIETFSVLFWGNLSDTLGRKRLMFAGMVALGIFSYFYWVMLDSKVAILAFGGIVLSFLVHDMQFGPQASFIAESFTGRLRYSGASLGYHLAGAVAGGTGPLVAAFLISKYHSTLPITAYMMFTVLVSIVALLMLKERAHQDLGVEYDVGPKVQTVTAPVVSGE